MSVARTWGSSAEERHASYPCDDLVPGVNDGLFRTIDVAAPADVVFRWFCQLKVAPYSYDLIDNRGRRSPRKLTPGAEQLEVGQRFMRIFALAEFEPGREVTLIPLPGSPFSNIAVTYRAVPTGAERSRIVVKVARRTDFGIKSRLLPWFDLMMMHKQLVTLKRKAEGSSRFSDWGSTADEREQAYPCDRLIADAHETMFRTIDVDAPPAVAFRWVCQLKIGPYSYDLIDNFGHRSPAELTPGAEQLALGQRFMASFELAEFEPGREVTLLIAPGRRWMYGDLAVTYRVIARGERASRIVVKIAIKHPRGRVAFQGAVGAPLDLIMMRKQLMKLKQHAERTQGALPFIDRHEVEVAADPESVWRELMPVMEAAMGSSQIKRRFAKAVGTEDLDSSTVGFHVERSDEPRELLLAGEHRFSRYTLGFELEPAAVGTRLTAVTRAEFPGVTGQIYKTLVIRSRMHVLATRSMLGAVKRRALR